MRVRDRYERIKQQVRDIEKLPEILAVVVVGLGASGLIGSGVLKEEKNCTPVSLSEKGIWEVPGGIHDRIIDPYDTATWSKSLQEQYPGVDIRLGDRVLLPDEMVCGIPSGKQQD